ncbi:hypothetical protein KKF55_03775 [Patescibacteria group bacterium]|nr:hypothetical protein [Patescibacteria group bacterium]
MAKESMLIGLGIGEREELGHICSGIQFTAAQEKIAADAIIAYRDLYADIVGRVADVFRETLNGRSDTTSDEATEDVSRAVDTLLRELS